MFVVDIFEEVIEGYIVFRVWVRRGVVNGGVGELI